MRGIKILRFTGEGAEEALMCSGNEVTFNRGTQEKQVWSPEFVKARPHPPVLNGGVI